MIEPDPALPQPTPQATNPTTWTTRARNFIRSYRAKRIALYVGIAAASMTVARGGPEIWRAIHNRFPPKVELAFYDEDVSGQKRILEQYNISADVPAAHMTSSAVRIPIRLALKNAGAEDLSNVRVKIKYDPSVKVHSEALQKILGGSVIYEQPVGAIDRRDEYVFLEKTDELTMKFFTAVMESIALSKDEIPVYLKFLLVFPEAEDPNTSVAHLASHRTIPIEVSIVGDRAPLLMPISLNVKFEIRYLWPPEQAKPTLVHEVSDQDRKLVQDMRAVIGSTSPVWTAQYDSGREISYYKLHAGPENQDLELVAINKDLRRIEVSTGRDGKLDYEIFVLPASTEIHKAVWGKSLEMVDWPKAAVFVAPNAGH